MTEHAIGSMISLISKSEIRYEGFLHFVNPDENTVGLKNVRMLGTEGRKKHPSEEIAASEQKYEFIIFRGADIKDLVLYQDGARAPAAAAPAARDPAIVQAMPVAPQGAGASYADRAAGRGPPPSDRRPQERRDFFDDRRDDRRDFDGRDFDGRDFRRRDDRRDEHRRDDRRDEHRRDDRRDDRRGYGRGYERRDAPPAPRSYRGGYRDERRPPPEPVTAPPPRRRDDVHTGREFVPATGGAKEAFKEEFDFSKSNDALERRKAEFEKAKDEARQAARVYDKGSFFDNISCEARDRLDSRGVGVRTDREEQKRTDTETFGSDMVGSLRGFRRGRGSRGRNRF